MISSKVDIKRFQTGDIGYSDVLQQLRSQRSPFTFHWDVGGELLLWTVEGEIAAFAILVDDGIDTFEVCYKFRGLGYGSCMIQELKQDRPRLWLSGYAFSPEAAKFWRKLGLYD